MDTLILPRRQFLKAAVGIIAAPAVVRFESLMKLSALEPKIWPIFYKWVPIREVDNLFGMQLPGSYILWTKHWSELTEEFTPPPLDRA